MISQFGMRRIIHGMALFSTVWKLRKFLHTMFWKKIVKATFQLKKWLKCWFHEIFFLWEQISRFSTLCLIYTSRPGSGPPKLKGSGHTKLVKWHTLPLLYKNQWAGKNLSSNKMIKWSKNILKTWFLNLPFFSTCFCWKALNLDKYFDPILCKFSQIISSLAVIYTHYDTLQLIWRKNYNWHFSWFHEIFQRHGSDECLIS